MTKVLHPDAALFEAFYEKQYEAQYGRPMPRREYKPRTAGYIYFVQDESGPIKIGWARDPKRRLAGLRSANPRHVRPLAAMPGVPGDEAQLHERFAASRIRGEWFEPTPELEALIAALLVKQDSGAGCL